MDRGKREAPVTKKQKAALVAAILTVASAFGLGVNGQVVGGGAIERVGKLEVRLEEREKALLQRLDSVDRQLEAQGLKLDRLIERGR